MVEALKPRRLFIALWPNAAQRRKINALVNSLQGGRRVKTENLHLTLAFLGATDVGCLRCYESALKTLRVPALKLTLDRLGFWSRPRILWLGPSFVPAPLMELHEDLLQRLVSCGYQPETRPFNPHITLLRKYPGPWATTEVIPPIHWETQQVALMESLTIPSGVRCQILKLWTKD